MKDKITLARRLREAGAVRRAHTVPHHGVYTVAQHSWDAAMLLLMLHPDPSLGLLRAVLLHDVAERHVGDLPAPAKWASAEVARHHGELEADVLRGRFGGDPVEGLDEDERSWLRCVDMIEFYHWCQDQLNMGNRHVRQALACAEVWIADNIWKMPEELRVYLQEGGLCWERLPERF